MSGVKVQCIDCAHSTRPDGENGLRPLAPAGADHLFLVLGRAIHAREFRPRAKCVPVGPFGIRREARRAVLGAPNDTSRGGHGFVLLLSHRRRF